MNLKTAFRNYKKVHILNYLNRFWGYKFGFDLKIDEILDALSEEEKTKIAEHISGYKNCPDFWNYT